VDWPRIYEATPDMNIRGNLGIAYLEELCSKGTADKIAGFYKYETGPFLHASSRLRSLSIQPGGRGGGGGDRKYFEALTWVQDDGGVKLAKISVGPRQWLVYRETDNEEQVHLLSSLPPLWVRSAASH